MDITNREKKKKLKQKKIKINLDEDREFFRAKQYKVFKNVYISMEVHRGSIPGRVIPKTQKMVLDAALLSTQHYEVRIKGKVEQSREWSSALPYASV